MKLPWSENYRWYALVAGLVGVLALLAVLQYRSVKAVSVATAEQMHESLRGSLMDVRQGLEQELSPLCRELHRGPEPFGRTAVHEYALRFERWRSAAAHATLVDAVYILQQDGDGSLQTLRLDSNHTNFAPVAEPGELTKLSARLAEMSHLAGPPPDHETPSLSNRSLPPAPNSRGAAPPDRPMPIALWMIDQNVPALVSAIRPQPFRRSETGESSLQWLVVVLNRNVLGQHVLPELIQRYFGKSPQSSYEIAVVDKNRHAPDLYVSDSDLKSSGSRMPDASLNLFGRPVPSFVAGERPLSSMFVFLPSTPNRGATNSGTATEPFHEDHNEQGLIVEPIHYRDGGEEWELIAKHRKGSVEAAVAALTARNLMFNFAVLLVLAATMAMIIKATMRARRFGRLQMDFVANVSHELRTPLTGIVSAAQNIADGLIDDKQKMAVYGKAILGEAHQLSELVEQILQFSAIQRDGDRYHIQPVEIVEVLQFALNNTSALVHSAGIKVEQQLQPGLPPVSADFKALSRCLQNLIANAVKYGGDGRWIGIRAWMANSSICIAVADKGIGIRRDELDQIFKPFYRTAEATDAQIHGNGLGLPLAKRIAASMGGTLTVESEPGQGSTFTVRLPTK
jgi:signal transduction histidine kinase